MNSTTHTVNLNRQLLTTLYFTLLACLFIFGVTTHVLAETAPNSIQLQYLKDSSDSEDIFFDTTLALTDKTSLLLSAGNTKANGANPIDLDYRDIGLTHQFSDNFDMLFKYETISQGNEIEADTIKATLTWSTDLWSFGLTPEYRELSLLNTLSGRQVSLSSNGIGVSVYYYGIKNWEYGVSLSSYDYSANTRILSLPIVIRLISSNAFTVASGLLDYSATTSASYFFQKSDLGATYTRNKSAIDGKFSNTFSLRWNLYHFKPFTLGLEAGTVSSSNNVGSSYSGLTLGYRW